MNQTTYRNAGLKVFGLYGAKGELCDCGNEHCKALFKHPVASNWQYTPDWSDDQFETMHEMGQFDTGFGVLVSGLLVIDVDARNGGVDSFMDLCRDLGADFLSESGFAVATGSGDGSMHLYFKLDETISLLQHHDSYEGIDFKSSGYVVGCGSLHKSGKKYTVIHGSPENITTASDSIIKLLKKPDTYRIKTGMGVVDMTSKEIADVLNHIDCDCDYDTWIKCGMAVHDALKGDGFEIWDDWSRKGKKYTGIVQTEKHWHSFGKSSNPVSAGTLIFYAEQNGYQQNVEFEATEIFEEETQNGEIDISGVDVKRPPGFAGELTSWINNQCLYPRETCAVATALTAIGNITGMRYRDEMDGMTANLFSFCIAGSSTGKEALQKAFIEIMKSAGISAAVHGGIKSEQELVRNLTRNQAAFYCIDELGIVLRKIMNAGKGGASYLEGVIGLAMSAYSKADSFLPVSGDVKDAIKKDLQTELASCNKKIDENEDKTGAIKRRAEQIDHALENIDQGLERPFLSILGFTTPVTFNSLIEYENATNGFLSRAMIFEEPENNPKRKIGHKKEPMSEHLQNTLFNMYHMGSFDALEQNARIEHSGDVSSIATTSNAQTMLDSVYQSFWDMAEDAKSSSGLEAIPRRGYELVGKLSFIVAIPEGVRDVEHVRWAYAVVMQDIDKKMKLAHSNMSEKDSPTDAIAIKIQSILQSFDEPVTHGVLINRCRPHKKENVQKVIDKIISNGLIKKTEKQHKSKKNTVIQYEII